MNDRKQQIRKVLETYTNRYTCAQMADRMIDIESETAQVHKWFEEQKALWKITDDEISEIIPQLAEEARQQGTCFLSDL